VIERSRIRLVVGALPAFHPSGVGKSSTGLLAGVRRGAFTCVRYSGGRECVIPYGK